MASDRMRSPASSEFYKSKSSTSHDSDKSVISYAVANAEVKRTLPVNPLENREAHSYRNLPGLIETASSAECVVRKIVNTELRHGSHENRSDDLDSNSLSYGVQCVESTSNDRPQHANGSEMAQASASARDPGASSKSAITVSTNGEHAGILIAPSLN